MVTANSFKTSDYSGMLYELAPELKAYNEGELKSQKLPDLECIINLSSEKLSGMWRWADLMSEANKVSQTDVDDLQATLQFDDAINIQYTSGTTGFPKGCYAFSPQYSQ